MGVGKTGTWTVSYHPRSDAVMTKVCLLLLFSAVAILPRAFPEIVPKMTSLRLISLDFEVHGKVQGVFFRKYTQQEAIKLGLKGWCMNTSAGTVKGQLEGDSNKINDMKHWLQTTGSPSSRIEKAVFSNEKPLTKCSPTSFQIRK